MLAGEARALVRPQAPDDRDRLLEASDAQAGPVVAHSGLVVVGLHPSGAEPELVTSLGEELDRRGGLGQHDRMPVVDAVDQRSHPELARDGRDRGQGRRGLPLRREVVGAEDTGVPERLPVLDRAHPVVGGQRPELDAEAEGMARVAHRAQPSGTIVVGLRPARRSRERVSAISRHDSPSERM